MSVVSAFLVPGNPLPKLKPEVPGIGRLAAAMRTAGTALAASQPDAVLVFSTQWFAVLDQQWLTRPRSSGVHVDENWYEFGDLPYDILVDSTLAQACVAKSPQIGVHARGVDYDGFPLDSGTITAASLLNIGVNERPVVVGSNNLYHDAATTEKLAALAVQCAHDQGKNVAVVGVGGLSGSVFRNELDLKDDSIATESDDRWNRKVLQMIESGAIAELRHTIPEFTQQARAEMGFKHFHWVLGALGGQFSGARIHDYGPLYGSGAAVIEFKF
jgi:2-aminophenol/2-amino-5-chlorophenol 1,6-dioxygenase alpha subunit